jgi:hypothetical protein
VGTERRRPERRRWDDIFIASGMSYPQRYGINSLLIERPNGKKIDDAEFVLGIEPRKNLYTPWFEIDCSDPQERQAQKKLDSKVCVGQSAKSIVMAPRSSRSSVIFDLGNDGDVDIVTNDFNSEPRVLVSNLAQRKKIHCLKIVLEGTRSNRNGLGATVPVRSGGQTYTKYNDGKSGYLAQSVLPLYFGLGSGQKIERVEVDWPSGTKQVLTTALEENQPCGSQNRNNWPDVDLRLVELVWRVDLGVRQTDRSVYRRRILANTKDYIGFAKFRPIREISATTTFALRHAIPVSRPWRSSCGRSRRSPRRGPGGLRIQLLGNWITLLFARYKRYLEYLCSSCTICPSTPISA